jgi:hypothetical protein
MREATATSPHIFTVRCVIKHNHSSPLTLSSHPLVSGFATYLCNVYLTKNDNSLLGRVCFLLCYLYCLCSNRITLAVNTMTMTNSEYQKMDFKSIIYAIGVLLTQLLLRRFKKAFVLVAHFCRSITKYFSLS